MIECSVLFLFMEGFLNYEDDLTRCQKIMELRMTYPLYKIVSLNKKGRQFLFFIFL